MNFFLIFLFYYKIQDGLTATRHIMAESSDRPPQIIAVTANVYEQDQIACKEVGMIDFIGKPIKMLLLQEALGRCKALLG